jgi:glutamine amidotransferase
MLTIHRQTVMMHPIIDKYYERDPYHVRSSAFVQAKGLVTNEKAALSGSLSPATETRGESEDSRKIVGGVGGMHALRSLSPDLARRSLTPASAQDRRIIAEPA